MASASNMLNVLCNCLSFTVFAACLVLKVPQIVSIYNERSSRGLSINSVVLELCGYTVMLTYHCAMSYPFSTYSEYCLLVPQDLILLLMVLHFNGKLSARSIPIFGVYFFVTYALAFRLVPDGVLKTCITLVTPVSVSSKLLQIAALVRTQDAGTISATTWALATYSTLARCITTLVQTGDFAVLLNFSISCVLNTTMVFLIFLYRPKKAKEE